MVLLLTLSQKVNQWLGPFLLRQGIKLRFALLSRGVIRDNTPWLDAALLLPLAQRLISLEVHEETRHALIQRQRRGGGSSGKKAGTTTTTTTTAVWWSSDLWSNTTTTASTNNVLSLEEESTLRIQVLEKYLRPALVPDETWSNIRRWQFHSRLIKWARKEYLLAKHLPRLRTALDAFRALRESPQINIRPNNNNDNNNSSTRTRLPPSSLIQKAFAMEDWATQKQQQQQQQHSKNVVASTATQQPHDDMRRIAQQLGGRVISLRDGGLCFAHINPDDDDDDAVVRTTTTTKDLSLQDILQVAGGFVSMCGPFNALCEQADIYQLWSKEYIELLGDYLMGRVNAYDDGETIILDVGAGDGLLVQALRQHFESSSCAEKGPGARLTTPPRSHKRRRSALIQRTRIPNKMPLFIATDDGSWSISQKAVVENLSVEEAMELYAINEPNRQVIVLCSWMPMGQDWSHYFRKMAVDEYILIGECDDGQCGDNYLTWGNHSYAGDVDDELELALSPQNPADSESSPVTATTEKENQLLTAETTSPIPYRVDGYQRQDLDNLLPYQFSRFDCKVSKSAKTVSFRRTIESSAVPP